MSTLLLHIGQIFAEPGLSRRFRIGYLVAISALTLTGIAVLVAFFIVIRPVRGFTVVQPIEVLTPKVRAGEAVTLRIDYCKHARDVAIVGSVIGRNGIMIPLNLWPSDLPLGCHKVGVMLQIPEYVPPDTYQLYMVREYRPSLFGVSGHAASTQPFEVLPAAGSKETMTFPVPAVPPTNFSPPITSLWDR